jgi:hypothetical protein
MNLKRRIAVLFFMGIWATAHSQEPSTYTRRELDSLMNHYQPIAWSSSLFSNTNAMPRSQMYPMMQSLQDMGLTKKVTAARTKRGISIVCAAVATIILLIPKETQNGPVTTTETGLFARPAGLVFLLPALMLQSAANSDDEKAVDRYNAIIKERFYKVRVCWGKSLVSN